MKKLIIEENDANQTLIKFLNKYLNKAPNSLIYKWIRTKKIKVNRKKTSPSQMLQKGYILEIFIYDEELDKWKEDKLKKISKIKVDIIYEDKDIIVFDKPQNLLVHASSSEDYGKTVVDFMIDYLIYKKEYLPKKENTFRPALINRIDRNTMGLIVGAKNRNSLLKLNSNKKSIHKYYLTIVEGKLNKELIIKNNLVKNDNMVKISSYGKESITKIKPIYNSNEYSLVEVELITGRTHQIRATLSDIGHPIIGDRKYGKTKSKIYKDQQLVAYRIYFDENIGIDSLRNLTVKSNYENYIFDLYKKIIGE